MQAIQKAHPILFTLVKVQRKYNKDYSWPSQNTLIELMTTRQGIKKSRATLNRWLRAIEDQKYLVRRRRIRRHPVYGTIFKSTLYKITIKGYRLLNKLGVDMADEIQKYEKWLEEIDPQRKSRRLKGSSSVPRDNEAREAFVKDIVTKLEKLHVIA